MNSFINPLANSSLPLFNHIALISINFIAVSLLVMVFIENRLRERKSILFIFMGIFMLIWVDFAYLARLIGPNDLQLAEIFLRVAWVATPMLFYITYATSESIILEDKKTFTWTGIILFLLAAALSTATATSDFIIKSISFQNGSLDISYGIGFLPFLAGIGIFMIFTIIPLIRAKFTDASKSFLFGVMIFYVFNLIFNIGLPFLAKITHLYYLGDYSTIFLLGFTLYAVFRHGLLDVKVFTTEILTIVLWSLLLARILVFRTFQGLIIDIIVLIFSFVFGYLLLQSVKREIEQKEQLHRLTERLKQLDAQKDEFLNVAAHELRAPMTAIKGYLSMIAEGDAGKLPKEATEYLQEGISENDRLIRLVNNLLNISRIEENRLTFEMGNVKLSKVVKTSFDSFVAQAKEKGLTYSLDISENIEDTVYVDKDRIYEVVNNLISNAIKYTDDGSVSVILKEKGGDIRFEVKDTGGGMSEKEQKKLFSKFYRAESSINKKIGTGLGLYISKLLVLHFKGEIGASSKLGKGSLFWFELPVQKR